MNPSNTTIDRSRGPGHRNVLPKPTADGDRSARHRRLRARLQPTHLVASRAQAVEAAVNDLRDGACMGVVIHGVFGAGTSTVARAVLAELVGAVPILRAEHQPEGTIDSPLGGLAFMVAALAQDRGLPEAPLHDPAAALDLVAGVCRERRSATGPTPVMVIQDLHRMPPVAQQLVSALLGAGLVKVILVASTASATHAAGDLLPVLRRGLLRAHTLSALDGDGVRELMEQELGGVVPSLTAQWTTMLTAGVPRLVISYLDRAREDGLLVFDDGLWHFTGPVEGVSDELREVVAVQLAQLTAAQREALFVVVLAERIEMNPRVNGALGEDLEALLESGMVQSRFEGQRWSLLPSCEHFAEAVRQHLPPGLAVHLGARHDSVLDGGLGPESRAAWAVNTGTAVDSGELVSLAAAANDRLWADYALRTVEGPVETARQPAADLERLRARIKLRHHLEAGAIATAIDTSALDVRQLRLLMTCEGILLGAGELPYSPATWASRWEQLSRSALAARDDAGDDAAGDAADDPGDGAEDGSSAEDERFFEHCAELVQLWADWGRFGQEDRPEVWEHACHSDVPEIAMLGLCLSGRHLTRRADLNASAEAWSRALLLAEDRPGLLGVFTDSARIGRLWAGALSGDPVTPLSALPNTWGPEDSAPYLALAGHYYAATGMHHLIRGTADSAHGYFRAAVACSRDDTAPHLLAMCRRALELTTFLTTGRLAEREDLPEPTDPSLPDADLLPLRWAAALFDAVARTAQDNAADLSTILGVLESATADGEVVTAHFALAQIMQTGEDAFIRKLLEVSHGTSGLYQELVHRICRAVLSVDVEELVTVGLQCHAAGIDGLAGDALERSLVLLSPYAPKAVVTAVTEAADAAFKATGRYMRPRSAAGGRRNATLTAREQQVAELVAQGLTNAQVAAELGLGRRTVEGHVYRLFDKLGISQRGEVEDALRG